MSATPPIETIRGDHDSIFMVMSGLGSKPASGRLLRGLSPFLDEQGAKQVVLLAERQRREPWRGADEIVRYQELVHWDRTSLTYRGTCIKADPVGRGELVQAFQRDPLSLVDWAARRAGAAVVSSAEPLRLVPCIVDKPWGREVWYTGIEARGVSLVCSAAGCTELPYALGMFPVPLLGEEERPPTLLKLLEPHPVPGLGDLYLEVHREKWEAYVVQAVDETAWPDGTGQLLAGLRPAAIEQFRASHGDGWREALLAELGRAIGNYEQVRREIDPVLDGLLRAEQRDPALPADLDTALRLRAALPRELRDRETAGRAAVDALLHRVDMPVGAVAVLPPGTLHSLRHGVNVVEFQTPTYERLVALSSQKVLTQDHWDTAEALATMDTEPYRLPAPTVLCDEDGCRVEQVVDFPQFLVHRWRIEAGRQYPTATPGGDQYHLIHVLSGDGALVLPDGSAHGLKAGEALLLGAALGQYRVEAAAGGALTCLVATARQDGASA